MAAYPTSCKLLYNYNTAVHDRRPTGDVNSTEIAAGLISRAGRIFNNHSTNARWI